MSIRKGNVKYGLSQENEVLNILKDHFKIPNLRKTVNIYSTMDFTSEDYEFELKSRKFEYNKYPTTIIGDNKIQYAATHHKTIIFVFKFTDGIYFIKYDKNLFKDFITRNETIFRDNKTEKKYNCHIPIEKLTKI